MLDELYTQEEAERWLLGSMLMHDYIDSPLTWSYDDVRAVADAEHFVDPQHRDAYKAICAVLDEGSPVEWLAVLRWLKIISEDIEQYEDFLAMLAESYADPGNGVFYAQLIRQAWLRRRLGTLLIEQTEALSSPVVDTREVMDAITVELAEIDKASTEGAEAISEVDLLRSMVNPAQREAIERIPMPIGDLARVLAGGFDRGTLTIVGARPACGKTSFGLTLIRAVSRASDGCPSLFVSAEMTARQLEQRLLSLHTRIPVYRIRSGGVHEDEFEHERQQAVRMAVAGHPVYILDSVNDCGQIAAICRRYVRTHNVGFIVVDYLGRLWLKGKHEREDLRLGMIVRMFKSLSLETNTAVMVLSQLSRESDKAKREPQLSDLRNSGEIEQEADNILLLHPGSDKRMNPNPTTIIIAKQRQGSTDRVQLGYHKETMSYEQIAMEARDA